MSLENKDIEKCVKTLVAAYLIETKTKVASKDEAVLKAGVDLVINLLQNINDIAYCAVSADERANR